MIIIHIESGLGNQMLSYCEYLSLKHANPEQEFYLETIVYEIPECNDAICQWNGYELERIFHIDSPPNIKTLFPQDEWARIIREIRDTEFWKHNWNYPRFFTQVLNRHGLKLENVRGNFEEERKTTPDGLKESGCYLFAKRCLHSLFEKRYAFRNDFRTKLFGKYEGDVFTGQWLRLKYRGNDRELIENEMKSAFVFPEIEDARNKAMADYLKSVDAVAIHARRGDMLGTIAWCYQHGYFRRAVRRIRSRVAHPVFVFFTDPGSIGWCKENASVFGLDFKRDTVKFVDWNQGEDSFRDMQLMGMCKHAIITLSSFGWWGAWFIENPQKITLSPLIEIDTTNHC